MAHSTSCCFGRYKLVFRITRTFLLCSQHNVFYRCYTSYMSKDRGNFDFSVNEPFKHQISITRMLSEGSRGTEGCTLCMYFGSGNSITTFVCGCPAWFSKFSRMCISKTLHIPSMCDLHACNVFCWPLSNNLNLPYLYLVPWHFSRGLSLRPTSLLLTQTQSSLKALAFSVTWVLGKGEVCWRWLAGHVFWAAWLLRQPI